MYPSELIIKMAKKNAEENGYRETSLEELIQAILEFEDIAWGEVSEEIEKKVKEDNLI